MDEVKQFKNFPDLNSFFIIQRLPVTSVPKMSHWDIWKHFSALFLRPYMKNFQLRFVI